MFQSSMTKEIPHVWFGEVVLITYRVAYKNQKGMFHFGGGGGSAGWPQEIEPSLFRNDGCFYLNVNLLI